MWLEGIEMVAEFPGAFQLRAHSKYLTDYRKIPLPMTYGFQMVQDISDVTYMAIWFAGIMVDSTKSEHTANIVTHVDAGGTLITPYNTFQVLRVKHITTNSTSIYSWTPTGWVLTSQETEPPDTDFEWYTNEYLNVAECDGDGKGTGATFLKSMTIVGLEKQNNLPMLDISPNPTSGFVRIKSSQVFERIELFNSAGLKVFSGKYSEFLDVSSLDAGIYFVKVFFANRVAGGRFIKH